MDYQNPPYEYITEQARLEEVVKSELASRSAVSLDVEGDGLDPHTMNLILVQMGTPEKAYIFNAKLDLTSCQSILGNDKILKILQNGKFDYSALKVVKGLEVVGMFDTMLAERILTTGLQRENSLEDLAAKYLGVALDKDWMALNWAATAKSGHVSKAQLKYAANDVLVLFPLYEKLLPALQRERLVPIADLEFSLIPVVAEIEIHGSLIDEKKWRENLQVLINRRNEIAAQIQQELQPYFKVKQVDLFGNSHDVLNLNSPAQIMEAFRKLGLDLPSTGEAVLAKTNHPVAKLLLQYREAEKLITAFGENLLTKVHKKTGRIHPDFMQIGADTGRFACSNPNLQQIPTDSTFRSCFVPAKGYKFIVADYSQIELRIMAELSEDPAFMKAFKNDEDLHARTASEMYNVPLEKVDKKMRFNAKSINFGLMYGRGANSLAIQLGVSVEEAEKLLGKYFTTYRRVKAWLDKAGREAVKKNYSTTLAGRKRWFKEADPGDPLYHRLISHIERQGKNTPIQGSSADMTKYALVGIYRALQEGRYDAFPIHTVHDEIVVEVREDQAEAVREVVEREMIKAGEKLLKKVPVRVDAKIASAWEH
jgi:DNA polymerase-1